MLPACNKYCSRAQKTYAADDLRTHSAHIAAPFLSDILVYHHHGRRSYTYKQMRPKSCRILFSSSAHADYAAEKRRQHKPEYYGMHINISQIFGNKVHVRPSL